MKLSDLFTDIPRSLDRDVAGITADSRCVKPGYVFAALKGRQSNGEAFIPAAVAAGAVAVIADLPLSLSCAVISDKQPRRVLSRVAGRLYPKQPAFIAGVTGTNGKTSVARFAGQIWDRLGAAGGSMGTLGASAKMASGAAYTHRLRHTTPDPVEMHQILHGMATGGVTHLAMEVSSHGLDQSRADHVTFAVAAFTNLTQDHLDYHDNPDSYARAKARLFTTLLPETGTALINTGGAGAEEFRRLASDAGRLTKGVGRQGDFLHMSRCVPRAAGLTLSVMHEGQSHDIPLPLIGVFQAENALLAAATVIESGFDAARVLGCLETLTGVPGRMELAGEVGFDQAPPASVIVDYAHTPDAITTALAACRPHLGAGGRLHVVFGAGGDRDRAKRPLMGMAAREGADVCFITDDNPRDEDPARIRSEIRASCPDAVEIGDRATAIRTAIRGLSPGDMLLVAGKGHEEGQITASGVLPFNDREEVQKVLESHGDGRNVGMRDG